MSRASKPVVVEIVVSALRELADETYQRRVWVEGSKTEVSSMNEATAALFNDSGLDEAIEKNQVTFSQEVDADLKRLRAMLRLSLDTQLDRGTEAVIGSPEWEIVRQLAGQLVEKITRRE
jgi:hypothetical protein